MRKFGFLLIFSMVACLVGSLVSASDLEVRDIKTRTIGEVDSSGDIYFAIKANVRNLGHKNEVTLTLQAVDREGFELKDVTLSGKIVPGQSRVLTDKTFMPYKLFKQIDQWQVK